MHTSVGLAFGTVVGASGCARPAVVEPAAITRPAPALAPVPEPEPEPAPPLPPIVGQRVDDFQLLDHQGRAHRLYDHEGAPVVVLMTQGNGCPIVRNALPAFRALRDAYAERGVQFLLLNSNRQDDRASIAAEAEDFGFDLPVLVDEHQLVGESLQVARTAEVFVIDTATWRVAYHGPVDDRLTYQRQKPAASRHYLKDALDAVLEGREVSEAEVDAPGCLVDFPDRDRVQHRSISYRDTIAPLLARRCVECHQDGGIGPWAMDSYAMVKGFSPMIREVVRTDRMPPWHADPAIGTFANDKSLTGEETRALVHWIEAGAPRGEGPDPLKAKAAKADPWPLGEPDLVLTLPPFEVPATGVVEYQHPIVENPLAEARWLRASTIRVGSRETVHHMLSGLLTRKPRKRQAIQTLWGASVGAYAVGAESMRGREDLGTPIPAGGWVGFEIHYTTIGKPVTDQTQVGLYFHDQPPRFIRRTMALYDLSIAIPPGARRHPEIGQMYFPHDAILYSAFPHAHFRGYSTALTIVHPDGREEPLLSLPKYDFNWQRDYEFAEPVPIPAGSRLVARFVFDNSEHNPANPDPASPVYWGDYSHDEMLYVILNYRWVDETVDDPKPEYDRALVANRPFDMLDDDLDGVLQRKDLVGIPGLTIRKKLKRWDRDRDGRLTRAEFEAGR